MAQTGAVSMSMGLGGVLYRWLFRDSARNAAMAQQVKRETEHLKSTAIAVQEQLARYSAARDPFVAMLADVYERREEARIYKEALKDWRGPPE